jgi:RHS repeat-associated protein
VSNRRITLDGLALSSGMQYFAVPSGYVLDSAERLVIAYCPDSLQSEMVSWLGWPADSTLQWVWQDGYVLSDSGEVALTYFDGEASTTLDVMAYGSNGMRRTFSGREAEVALSDFEAGGWSLGDLALERKSIKFGFGEAYSWTQKRGVKNYELSDHLGNVAVVVGDRRIAFDPDTDLAVDFFEAEVLSARDFYPFGFQMPGRTFQTEKYRYGFQSQESDSEWLGEGNAVAFKYRVHDARLGRFLSVDPLAPEYPWNSGYAFAENRVVDGIELEGLEVIDAVSIGKAVHKGRYTWPSIQSDGSKGTYARTARGDIFVNSYENGQYFKFVHSDGQSNVATTIWAADGISMEDITSPEFTWSSIDAKLTSLRFGRIGARLHRSGLSQALERNVGGLPAAFQSELEANGVYDAAEYADVFQHIYGQTLLTVEYGEDFARFIGDAHERDLTGFGEFTIASVSDLINNEWGRQLGTSMREKYPSGNWTADKVCSFTTDVISYMKASIRELRSIEINISNEEISDLTRRLNVE